MNSPSGTRQLVMVMADGARADALFAAMDAGELPAIARLRDEGSAHTVTSVFPTVTGPAYTPFLMGLHPGRAGVPGIRWFDRTRSATQWPGYSRSYVGFEALRADRDLTTDHRTLFELASNPLAAFTPHGRGLRGTQRLGTGARFGLQMAWTHFRGDLKRWLALDRQLGRDIAERVRRDHPDVAFVAHPGIDKLSHQLGHGAPEVLDAMRTVDSTVAAIRADAERDGRWGSMEIWVVSDHGHSPVRQHEDLAGLIASWGPSVIAHPWTFTLHAGTQAAVMVSGNAMAHVYLELARRERPWWPALQGRWQWLIQRLLERPSVDLLILPRSAREVEVHARGRGMALVVHDHEDRYRYVAQSGDPFGICAALGAERARVPLTADDVHRVTRDTDYPDSLVQVIALAGSARAGEIMLSASRDWDYRAKYEPIPHVSSHGALHREHMLVPLVMSRAATGEPRRTVDVLPSALAALGRDIPAGLDGVSFR
jgi:hypothetical protein